MMQHPSGQKLQKEKKNHPRWAALKERLRSVLLENLGTKLLALLIAVALWAGLITQDPTLTREKQFSDVAVSIMGAETLKRNGFIILEDLDAVLDNVTVRVEVPQGQYAVVQPSNYSVRVDLSRIRGTGVQDVKILSTNSSAYGSVTEIVPPTVKLTVDEYITRYRIPVTVVTENEPPEGFYATAPSTDPPMIAVSGPRSVVERIVSARVTVDQAAIPAKEDIIRRALPITLVDEKGEHIASDMLEITSESVLLDSIVVEQQVYTQRTVAFSDLGLVTGEPAEGYEVKGVYVSPSSVTIAGRASALDVLSMLYAETSVNVKGLKESVTKSVKIRQPGSVKYVSADTVVVAVEIGPVITSRAYEATVQLEGLQASLREAGGLRTATVHLTGAQPWLESLNLADIHLTCDLNAISEPGTYTLPLTCEVAGAENQSYTCEITPAHVVVTVIER